MVGGSYLQDKTGNYIVLHIAPPNNIESKYAQIVFDGDCDRAVFSGFDLDGAIVVLRLNEQAEKVYMAVDWDNAGGQYD